MPITAKRAGWIGCNILLDQIPDIGKIKMVENSHAFEQNIQVTSQQALEILENAAFDIDLNYAGQAVEYHVDQFLMV